MIKDKEKRAAYGKRYRLENADKIKLLKLNYRKNNKEKIASYCRKYQKENKDKINAINKKYRNGNIEKVNRSKREYQSKNIEKYRIYRIRWYMKQLTDPYFFEYKKQYARHYYYNIVCVRRELGKVNDIMSGVRKTWCAKKINNINHPWRGPARKIKFEWEDY